MSGLLPPTQPTVRGELLCTGVSCEDYCAAFVHQDVERVDSNDSTHTTRMTERFSEGES